MFHWVAILFSIFGLVSCQVPANYHQASQGAAILSDARYLAGDGTFGAAYSQEDGVEFKEESDEYGNRKGSYSYVDPTGQRRTVSYTAGKDGFRPIGDHIPVPPPQVPQEPEYVLSQYGPQGLPPQFARPEYNPYTGEYDPSVKSGYYPPQGRFPSRFDPRVDPRGDPRVDLRGDPRVDPRFDPRFDPRIDPNYPSHPSLGRPVPRPQPGLQPYDPYGRPVYQPVDRTLPQPLDKPVHIPLQKPVDDLSQKPYYQSTFRPTSSPVYRPTPGSLQKPLLQPGSKPFPPPLGRPPIPSYPRPQSHYDPEYLAKIYPEYQSSGLETIGKAGPQYSGETTPKPRRFNPPGKLEFNRTPDGFSYTFNKS